MSGGHQNVIDPFPDFTGFNFASSYQRASYFVTKMSLTIFYPKRSLFFSPMNVYFLKSLGEVVKKGSLIGETTLASFSLGLILSSHHRELSSPNTTVPRYFQTGTLCLLKAVRVSRSCSFCSEFSLCSSLSSLFHLSVVPRSAFALKKKSLVSSPSVF